MHPTPHFTEEHIRESYYTVTSNLNKYENIEDITIIWLDSHLDVSLDCFDTERRLRQMIDHILTFHSKELFLEYLNSEIQQEQIFLIVSGSDGELIVPQIYSLSKISSIYIFCNDTIKHEQWTKAFTKIRGVFNTKDMLFKRITSDITLCLTNLLPIRILAKKDTNQKSLYDLTFEGARSMWFQLLIEALVNMKHSDEAKNDLLEISRKQYKYDRVETRKIDEFDRTYTPDKAVWWYTTDSFLYRLLNRALRTENIDIIYKFRSFLADLDNQIRNLHKEQSSSRKPNETFYRGQKIPAIELKTLQENIGGYIAMNTFTSVSESSVTALNYAGNGEERPELESILFQIEINIPLSPCAHITKLSQFPNEEEILLTTGSVFRIVNVEPFYNRWIVELTLDKSDNRQMEELKNYLKKQLFNQSSQINLARILFQMSDYNRAEHYCIRTEKELASDDNDRAGLYQLLGEIYQNGKGDYNTAKEMYDKALCYSNNISQFATLHNHLALLQNEIGEYDTALKTLKKADALCRKDNLFDPFVVMNLANIYVNTGIVYRHKLDFVRSLQYYKKALDLNLQILPELHPSLSILYNNTGHLNCIICDYDASLKAYEKALNIQSQCLPKIHIDLATVHNNMAIVYMVTGRFLAALESFSKALNMFETLLETNHPTIATLHHNIGDTYQRLKQNDKAVNYLEKALEMRIEKLPLTHKHIAESYESLAWTYYHLLNYEKALDFCEKTLEIEPDSASAYHCKGLVFDSQCNYNRALSALQKALGLYENFPAKRTIAYVTVHKTIADIFTIQEKLNDAIAHYNKAIDLYHCGKVSNSTVIINVYNARGAFFCRTGKYDEALNDLKIALDMARNIKEYLILPSIFVSMGNLYLKQSRLDEALKCIKDAEDHESALFVEQYSMKGEKFRLLADILFQQEQYDNALQNYKNALEIFSQSSSSNKLAIACGQIDLGRTYERKCLYDESLSAFLEALHLLTILFASNHPTIADIYYKIARIHKMRHIDDIAFSAFETALHKQLHSTSINYPVLADIYDNLADIAFELEQIKESHQYYQESLEIRLKHNPYDAFLSYVNMGRLKNNQGQYLEAEELFKKAIDAYVSDNSFAASYSLAKIYIDLALVYNSVEKYDKAMETISKATETRQIDDEKTDSLI
ncbi:unnamed protein product, partial [Rotaria sp. Silwood1]